MQNESDEEKGSSEVVAQATGPDLFSVEVGAGSTLRVEIDGWVIRGKRVTVKVVPDSGEKVSWDELKPGHLYVDRHISGGRDGEISGVLQVRNDGMGWRWVWTPYGEGGWGEMYWYENRPSGQRDNAGWVGADAAEAELVSACATDDEADACAVFTTWADSHGERLRQG